MVFKNLENCYKDGDPVAGMTLIFPGWPGFTASIEDAGQEVARTDVGLIHRSAYKSIVVCLRSKKTGTCYPMGMI